MNKTDLENIVSYIAKQGLAAINENTEESNLAVDYLAIFSKDEAEFKDLESLAQAMGEITDEAAAKTGLTFKLKEPIETPAGPLRILKIRKPDATRPQRGAPDFRVDDYDSFKDQYLQSSGNFSLMVRKDYEMIELKGVDVLVYFPSKTFAQR